MIPTWSSEGGAYEQLTLHGNGWKTVLKVR